ncbi:guanylate kinase [candidate division WOR-1 bacterium RIFOXYA2_FULL_36_21]|uniref:Guanylate kinase n=1 Tax=candidate division WOR-1 bacterium RIFOXYB2_FULL_36_35 TaxID=1802578 RepID=A0A1F4S2I0_UNCSA|nr:MAG: guanylate kinase [candidate division WOR-1 bacterium RIFOXYA2_FULL_36_21]OGC14666.1 MAG: guanylate kinase [candidate division WOR-1 bacterium RIFOXYB2_FULL_36_35]OGC19684.1 MAG: guanylate kinase [candidate division WOR-1 bacterium RIFOXYA12_FULL_36_13]
MPKKKGTRRGFLVVISGPSGVGKSTVVRRLFEIFPELKMSISATTRPPRPMEKNKTDYHFLSEEEFFKQAKNGSFLEWAQVHKYYYGTPIQYVKEEVEKNNIVVAEVDVQGAASIKEHITQGKLKCAGVFIFLIPPSVDILAFRLKRRKTEKAEVVNYRLRAAIAELQVMEKYDYIVVNDKIDSAAQKIKAIINVEKERVLLN